MTTTLAPAKTRGDKSQRGGPTYSGAGLMPQVNLLPPEVRAARSLRTVRGLLLVGLLIVVCALVAGYVFAMLSRASAQDALADAEADTQRLQAEQREYAEVPRVLGALDEIRAARLVGMSTEVNWRAYLGAVTAVLPTGVSLDQVAFSGATPTMLAPPPTSPLQDPSIGQLTLAGRSLTLPDTAAIMRALDAVPGLTDAWVTSAAVAGEEGSPTYYAINATVQVTMDALTNRFLLMENEDEAAAEGAEEGD